MASQEECLDGAPIQQDATTSPVESILKELTELRRANQKLNDRLHCVLNDQQQIRVFLAPNVVHPLIQVVP